MADDCDIILAANYCSSMSDLAPDPKLKEQWLSLAAGCLSLARLEQPPKEGAPETSGDTK